MADALAKFRQGTSNGRNIYFQTGPEPSKADPQMGVMDTPELAALFVAAMNAGQDGFLPWCLTCRRPVIAHQGELCPAGGADA